MERTVTGSFATRRDAELVVEHLVQERGIERADIFIQASGQANSAGSERAGADLASGQSGAGGSGAPELTGRVEVSVDCHGDDARRVEAAFEDAGAQDLQSK